MSEQLMTARVEALEADNARLRAILDKQGLPAELRHQVRNTLANVRAIIRRSGQTSRNSEDYAAHLEDRFDALLGIQDVILASQSGNVKLETLISKELHRFRVSEGRNLSMSGPSIVMQPRAAEVLAMTVHELVINALEHGCLTQPAGAIGVDWVVDMNETPPHLDLRWQESGLSACQAPTHSGFGTEVLLHMLPYELNAKVNLDYRAEGLVCSIRLPLAPTVGMVQEAGHSAA